MTIEASAAHSARIDHYTAFWSEVVGPDYEEFMKAQHDLRLAFHCAVSLFHMSDWVYEAEKATVDASFTFIDKNGVTQPVRNSKQFANALRDLEPDFELIRQIANSAKHLKLSRSSPHPGAPTHAANTSGTGYGEGGSWRDYSTPFDSPHCAYQPL